MSKNGYNEKKDNSTGLSHGDRRNEETRDSLAGSVAIQVLELDMSKLKKRMESLGTLFGKKRIFMKIIENPTYND